MPEEYISLPVQVSSEGADVSLQSLLAGDKCERCGAIGCSVEGYEIYVALLCQSCTDWINYRYAVDTFAFRFPDFEVPYWVPVTRPLNPLTR